jgi:MFS family permease
VRPSVRRVALLLGILIALTIIGSSAVAVALPVLGDELGIDLAGRAWVLVGFGLAFPVTTAVFGRLADLMGLRLPLRIGILLFVTGSALGAIAPGFPLLMIGRLLQGAGAGAVPVLSFGVVAAVFDDEHRPRALGGLMSVVALVSGAGPLLGGTITEFLGWRAVLALPIVAITMMEPVARLAPPGRPSSTPNGLDARGAFLLAVTIVGAVLALQSPSTGAGPAVLAAAALAALTAAVGLARHTRRVPDGFLPLTLVRDRRFVLTAFTAPTLLAPYFGLLLVIPQVLAAELGWTPLQIGLALLPAASAGAVASRVAGATAVRVGRYRLAASLAVASAAGLLLVAAFAPAPAVMVAGLALTACGFAAGQVALLDSVTDLVEPGIRGSAVGIFNVTFFTGATFGAASIGGLAGLLGLRGAVATLAVLPALGVVSAVAAERAGLRGDLRDRAAAEPSSR